MLGVMTEHQSIVILDTMGRLVRAVANNAADLLLAETALSFLLATFLCQQWRQTSTGTLPEWLAYSVERKTRMDQMSVCACKRLQMEGEGKAPLSYTFLASLHRLPILLFTPLTNISTTTTKTTAYPPPLLYKNASIEISKRQFFFAVHAQTVKL